MIIQFEYIWLLPIAIVTTVGIFILTRKISIGIMVSLVILAASSPFIVRQDPAETAIFLIDRSESMNLTSMDAAINELSDLLPESTKCFPVEFSQSFVDQGTNIEGALFYAMNLIRQNGSIYLFSDLLQTTGQTEQAVYEMSKRNIRFEVIVPDYKREKEVILKKISIPPYITQNQTLNLDVTIESGSSCDGQLKITNKQTGNVFSLPLELKEGVNFLAVPADTGSSQLDYELSVLSDIDTYSNNNTRQIQAEIHSKPLVGVVGSLNEFDTINSMIADYANGQHVTENDIPDCDLLILADCNQKIMTGRFIEQMHQKIEDGMGLLVLPGDELFADNLLEIDAFSDLLPVKLNRQNKQSSPDACIVFIVDTSGSMQGTRLILAKGIVRSTFERLSNYDKAGIVEFYGNRKWAAPIQFATNQIDLNRAVNRLTAGGGTVILPAIEEAYYGLLNAQAASKHIVVITDGGIESGDYQSLLRRIREDNINISFVLTGPAAHTGFLSEMSMYGGGKFFHAANRFSLPEIDIKTLSAKNTNLFRSNRAQLEKSEWSNILTGIDLAELPVDITYVPATGKLASHTILKAGTNPILTGWHVGLGRAIFSHSNLLSKKNTGKLFQNMCRHLYKQPQLPVSSFSQQNDFEIKSCEPDYKMAEQIGKVASSEQIHQIKTIDLSGYCMLASLMLFLWRVVQRRLLRREIVIAALLLCAGGGIACAGYPETMKTGIQLYGDKNPQALDTIINAYHQSQSTPDKKYALAWALLVSQRDNNFDKLEAFILDNLNADTAAQLNIVYAINGDFNSARQLCEKTKMQGHWTASERKQIERQMADIALISRQFDEAAGHYQQNRDIVTLMKINLLQGRRNQALALIEDCQVEKLSSLDLFELCKAMLEMGFSEAAYDYAKKLKSRKDEYFYEATEFIAEMLIKSNRNDQAKDVLISAIDGNNFSNKQLFEIGILLEKTGHVETAIEVHQTVYDRTQAADCLIRIASLKDMLGRHDDSYRLWLELWRQSYEPFEIYQIVPRLLEVAAKNQSLPDLVISLEQKVSAGNASSKEVDLLIDIYTSINDPFTSIEIVKQYYETDSLESLKKQYHICRQCRLYRQCYRILKRLIKADSKNAADYLQQMAILAVERGNPKDAVNAAEQLKDVDADLESEFTAGLLSMLGQHEDAMAAFHQMIVRNPNSHELWLLWAEQASNCSQAIKETAIQRLAELLKSDSQDDQFLVTVDALLNLQAPQVILQKAYDITLNRIKGHPEKVYMYRLAIDILSELGSSENHTGILLGASCYAPQRRLAFIQEAMDSLGTLSPERLDLAKLLVFMNWQCSPGQYIKLGQMFLENDQSNLAEYLFRCNSLLNAENKSLYLSIADVYQRRSDFNNALEIMQEALALYPNDIHILIETASYHEILGQFSRAYDLYSKVYRLTRSQQVANHRENQDGSKNINTTKQFSEIAFEGMIVTADQWLPDKIQAEYDERMSAEPIVERKSATRPSSVSAVPQDRKTNIDMDLIDIELEELINANQLDGKFARRIRDIVDKVSIEQAEYLFDEYKQYAFIIGENASLQYLNASLAVKIDKKQQAKNIIKRCYADNSDNRIIEFKLKSIMEDQGDFRELAETLVNSAQTQAKSPHFWREITRLYYQAGDVQKAKWANAYASSGSHFILQVLDYLFLYTKEQNYEKMKQYFRKYQVDCRKKGKYYALRWNYWDESLSDDSKSNERPTAYMILSQFPQLFDEFQRYCRVVYPNRRDRQGYLAAYENILKITKESQSNSQDRVKKRKEN